MAGETHVLSREEAYQLRAALAEALTTREEFVHTVGKHREDESYVVERRGADSTGNRKVFEEFADLRRLFAQLPHEFRADDLSSSGLTAGRRHMVLRHFVEHPAFPCQLTNRQPLVAEKFEDTPHEEGTRTDHEVGVRDA